MKTTNRLKIILPAIIFIGALSISSMLSVQDTVWEVPDDANKMVNPVEIDDEGLDIGKGLYTKHCKSCHGKEGLGDGTKAAELDTPAGDFSTEEFQAQTDGALFYKTTEGRDDMPTFKKKVAYDEDRWLLVHYMRTLAE